MNRPGWLSQPVPPLGAITSAGIKNALGRPNIDRLTVLVRETAQNSWDAATAPDIDTVRFAIALRSLDDTTRGRWLETFAETPEMAGVTVRHELSGSDPRVMFISDRGTKGLGGPTRADVPAGQAHNYVSMVLNIGDRHNRSRGGGTFGYGKAVYFTTARAAAVIAYTRCRAETGLESRLIGMALGEPRATSTINYTGRHWWGTSDEDGILPLRNGDADALAASLGFPGFVGDETGTTFAIISPELDTRTPDAAGKWIAEAILWHLWPKMVPTGENSPPMAFSVTVDDRPVSVPAPFEHPAIRLFARQLQELDAGEGQPILGGNPKRHLGMLRSAKTFEPPPQLGPVAEEALGAGHGATAVHHACLLRAPRLVVEYLAGPVPVIPQVWYGGVFLAEDAMDKVFARSEPPTHDTWVASQLDGTDKRLVNAALRRITESLQRFAAPQDQAAEPGDVAPLGATSRYLSSLLGDIHGQGAGPTGAGGGGSGTPRSVRLVGDPTWDELDGESLLAQQVAVKTTTPVTVEPRLGVGLWGGGAETDPPAATARPDFIAWQSPTGEIVRDATIAFAAHDNGDWTLLVRPAPDTVTSITLRTAVREEPI